MVQYITCNGISAAIPWSPSGVSWATADHEDTVIMRDRDLDQSIMQKDEDGNEGGYGQQRDYS